MSLNNHCVKRDSSLVFLAIVSIGSLATGLSAVAINERTSYFNIPSVKDVTWNAASDRCTSLGKQLCLKKDLCVYSHSHSAAVPRPFVKRPVGSHMYVPVGDTYNDWVYLGPWKSNRCERMTRISGPPIWKGKGCKEAVKTSNVFTRFCQSSSGIYCCRKSNKMADLQPHPVTVYVSRYEKNDGIFYSFSLNKHTDSKKSIPTTSDEISSKNYLTKFSLMSAIVPGKFKDPIFFCSRSVRQAHGNTVEHFHVSNKWCNWGWKLNFYLYGSLTSLPDSQRYESNLVDYGKNLRTRISVNGKITRSWASFLFYGPKFSDGTHITFSETEAKRSCDKDQHILLTSLEGVIDSNDVATVADGTCRWKIRGPSNSVLKIRFLRMNLKPRDKATTRHQQVSISNSQYVGRQISNYDFYKACPEEKVEIFGYGRFCGTTLPPVFDTIDNEIDISFVRGNDKKSSSDFSLSYEVVSPPNGLIRKRLYNAGLTWGSANESCAAFGKTLCRTSDICERTGGRPFYGVQENDQWTPVIDEYNDWLQIGRGNIQTCKQHNSMFGPPLWGTSPTECNSTNPYLPCPKRDYLYCCNPSIAPTPAESLVDVLVYSIAYRGTVFSKYVRKHVDEITSFDDTSLTWTHTKKGEDDFETIKLNSHYSSLFDKPIYFCQREVVPAIGGIRFAYSMLSQPCQSQGWKYLYHLYGMSTLHPGASKYYVGLYEKRPFHSRVSATTFPSNFESSQNFVFYSYLPTPIMADAPVMEVDVPSLCGEMDSSVTAPSVILSPGYPESYGNKLNCKWIVKKPEVAREEDILRLTVTELELEDPVDVLTIKLYSGLHQNESTSIQRLRTLTGIVRQLTMETTGYFELNFKTDETISKKGFRIAIDIITTKCGGEVRSNGDFITSQNYPSSYPVNTSCEWIIEAPSMQYDIEIKVVALDLITDYNCSDKIVVTSRHIEPIVLCGNNTSTENIFINGSTGIVQFYTSKADPKSARINKGFSLRVFFTKRKSPELALQCGTQSVSFGYSDPAEERIVGGKKATIANFPWLVHIEGNSTICAGTLLSKSWVLTAAHCLIRSVESDGTPILFGEPNTLKIIAGRHRRYISNPGEQVRGVIRAQFRSDYRSLAHLLVLDGFFTIATYAYNDIVLLKLDKEVEFTPFVQPICLPTQDAHVGDTCYIAGWGDTSSDLTPSAFLHYTKAPILESRLCNSYPLMRSTVFKNAFCAGYPAGGTGMCFGDSGGPLLCRGKYGNFYINGITSWSVGCARAKAPGVYTRVYNFIDWIKKVIERDSDSASVKSS